MGSATATELFLVLAVLLLATSTLSMVLERAHIPGVIAALLVAVLVQETHWSSLLSGPELNEPFSVLVKLGVLFLLFLVGLQLNPDEIESMSADIFRLSALTSLMPFLLGFAAMAGFGYPLHTALLVGMMLIPTAEIVVVPILEEVGLLKTRVGEMIVSAGTLDDVVEALLLAVVSVWLSSTQAGAGSARALWSVAGYAACLCVLALAARKWLVPFVCRHLPADGRHLVMVSMLVLLGFGGLAEQAGLGLVIGASTAGVVMRPAFARFDIIGNEATDSIRLISEGFLGLVFFFWVGLHVHLGSLREDLGLTALLCIAGAGGKLAGALLLVPRGAIAWREALAIGVGLDARLTTEIVVAQLLYQGGIIEQRLFTSLVAASSLTTLAVPVLFALMMRRWGDVLRVHGQAAIAGASTAHQSSCARSRETP